MSYITKFRINNAVPTKSLKKKPTDKFEFHLIISP